MIYVLAVNDVLDWDELGYFLDLEDATNARDWIEERDPEGIYRLFEIKPYEFDTFVGDYSVLEAAA